MTLLGTLLLPCLALTKDLANAAAAFTAHAPGATPDPPSTPPSNPSSTPPSNPSSPPRVETRGRARGMSNGEENSTAPQAVEHEAKTRAKLSSSPATSNSDVETAVLQQQQQPGGAVRAGSGRGRPALVTALAFLSPYPLLVGTSTGGAVLVWRTSDCVCVQAILLPADLRLLRRRRGSIDDPAGAVGAAEEEGNLTCLAWGTWTWAAEEENTVIYVGNGSGDIIAARLSPAELAELSGDANGPVPCQRRAMYNPYRAVRVELAQQAAQISFQVACRTQSQAALRAGAGGKPTAMPRGSTTDATSEYNFAVPSTGFHLAWKGHSAAVSSLSWISSPLSLLSSSADGLAKIWKPDGSALFGQLDINNKRPERTLFPPAKTHRRWSFLPGGTDDKCQQQGDLKPLSSNGSIFSTDSYQIHTMVRGGESKSEDGLLGGQSAAADTTPGELGNEGAGKDDAFDRGATGNGGMAEKEGGRDRSRRQQQGQHQQPQAEEEMARELPEEGRACEEIGSPPDMTFPTSPNTAAEPAAPAETVGGGEVRSREEASGGSVSGSESGSGTRKKSPAGSKPNPSVALKDKAKGVPNRGQEGAKPSWVTAWDCMARQLMDFEEKLEASSARNNKTDAFRLGTPLSSAITHPVRRTPQCGKRWRTKSAPWPGDDRRILQGSVSEQRLPTAGSVRPSTGKGMTGYVKPTAGSAEDAALKRLRSRGATGIVLKDTFADECIKESFRGRPLDEWLALPEGGRGIPETNASHGNTNIGETIKGLPPMAILAGSKGNRLVASGITISGDQRGGGFNIKSARAATKAALRQAALVQELADEEERRKAKIVRFGSRKRTTALSGAPRHQRQGCFGSRLNRSSDTFPRGRRHDGNDYKLSKDATNSAAYGGARGLGRLSSAGSLAPSFGGTVRSPGSAGSVGVVRGGSLVETEGFTPGASIHEVTAGGGAEATRNVRGLNEDSVVWASSSRSARRFSSVASRSRRRRGDEGTGQVETIRRLVHMGLF